MIEVIVNRPSFEYDIHSLVKSFFPREDVQIHVQDTFTEDTALRISVEFTDETVSVCLMEQGEEKESGASVINYAERKETKNRLKRQLYQLPDGNPSGEDRHGSDRAGHEQCRDRRIYAEYLSGKQGKGGTECHDRQPGTVCASKY